MKILIVCQHYWPENFRVTEIAEGLAARGHSVDVLTGLPNYETGSVPKEYRFFRKRCERINGVRIFRVPLIARHHGIVWRILNYLSFAITSSLFALTHHFEADVIFAYQLAPVFMVNAGIMLKKKIKKPLFLYCLDIWPDQMKVWGVGENNPAFRIVRRYCEYAYGSSDLVGITSRPFREYLVRMNKVRPERIVYLPQHSASVGVGRKSEGLIKEKKSSVDFTFAGNIGQQQNIECVIRAAARLKREFPPEKFHIHIYGDGSSLNQCREKALKTGVDSLVTFYGRVPKEELRTVYPSMDALLLTLCSEREIGFAANTVPAKLQEYMSIGKPIFAAIDGGAQEIIRESACGAVVPADDDEGLARIMRDFINAPEKYADCGQRATDYFQANYEKGVVINRLEEILFGLCKPSDAQGMENIVT